jgi:hypothetical protein
MRGQRQGEESCSPSCLPTPALVGEKGLFLHMRTRHLANRVGNILFSRGTCNISYRQELKRRPVMAWICHFLVLYFCTLWPKVSHWPVSQLAFLWGYCTVLPVVGGGGGVISWSCILWDSVCTGLLYICKELYSMICRVDSDQNVIV